MAIEKVNIERFLELSTTCRVLDVRSPGEYMHAHIPGAYNLPLFTDDERKVVGTSYKQQGRETAIKIGLDLFGVKMRPMVEEVENLPQDNHHEAGNGTTNGKASTNKLKTVLVHCWRGGMRSAAIAWLLDLYGFKVYTLTGGYKKFRHYVIETFMKPAHFKILGGFTGSGKTFVLQELANKGQPIIDLEALANHKGSAFGSLGRPPQPSQEMFENMLALDLRTRLASQQDKSNGHDSNSIWLEDESQRIGSVNIPIELWKQMRKSEVYFMEVGFEKRLTHIEEVYGKEEKQKMIDAILRIRKRLGGLETKMAIQYLMDDNIRESFRVLLKYYDKCYLKGLKDRDENQQFITRVVCENVDKIENAKKLLEAATNKNLEIIAQISSYDRSTVKLTRYSHGAGCGCKISPALLDQILKSNYAMPDNNRLIVGNHSKDDAAVYDMGNGMALIATTDFFMPIVDDAYEFGRIASANAISDVYAMGGKPVLAIAILGWPVSQLSAEIARRVIEGSRSICKEAGIPLAGGHSIDSPEPIFGLAVNGFVPVHNIKQNNSAREGNLLFLTKPLGVGILTTAEKKGILKEEHKGIAAAQMMELNKIGGELGMLPGVCAMTDVTGFGLLGHLVEMAEGSGLSAMIEFEKVPLITNNLDSYIAQGSVPGGTERNWESYREKINFLHVGEQGYQKAILADPQTSGGLLIAADPSEIDEVQALFRKSGLDTYAVPIGRITEKKDHIVVVDN